VAGVEQGHAGVERGVDRGDALLAIGCPVHAGHAHATEPDSRHGRAGGAQLSRSLHRAHVRGVPSAQAKPPPMTELQASRTLVKSPPELWAECSDAASLARHLDGFGEIRITRLEPETAVAWEGERARGTVRIEPAGWGTKVILTAVADAPPQPEPAVAVAPPA